MTQWTKTNDTADTAKAATEMQDLTLRTMKVLSQLHVRALKKASGAEYSLMDAKTLAKAYGAFWADMLQEPGKLVDVQIKASMAIQSSWKAMLQGLDEESGVRDRRFSDPSWEKDPISRAYRDVFLAIEGAANDLLEELPKNSRDHMSVRFYTRQMMSALSPSNYLLTNAPARKMFTETNGASFREGLSKMLDDLERGEGRLDIATNDPSAFTVGKDLGTTEGEVVFQNDLMQLIQYHPRTPDQHSVPILFVPAWINKFYILDMQPKNSLVRYMLDRGHSVFVISWVNPTSDHADKDFADYMKLGPLAALDAIRDITREEKANILGFCIGGILVTATLAYLAAIGDDRVNSATTLATMVDFKDVGEIGVFVDENRLEVLRAHMEEKGYLEAYHLQDMFSMLRENDLIWSFFEANYLRGRKPRAFDLLYWNSDSTRLPAAMLLWYLKEVYLENRLRQPGGLEMNGVKIDLSKIETPVFVLATSEDHIAPWTSIYPATQILGGEVEFVLGGSGHIAGVINPPTERAKYGFRKSDTYPPEPANFLTKATEMPGSWWPYWADWLEAKDGKTVKPRKPVNRGKYKSIEPAPGSYVRAN